MARGVAIAREERDWQADSDARTLAESEVIQRDGKRFNAAKKAAKKMAKDKQNEAAAMTKIAKGRPQRIRRARS